MTKTTRAELDPLIGEPDRFQATLVPMRHPLPARSPGVSNNLHFPSHLLSDPLASFACVPRIDPDFFRGLGNRPLIGSNRNGTLSRSWRLATWTTTLSSRPVVSTRRCL